MKKLVMLAIAFLVGFGFVACTGETTTTTTTQATTTTTASTTTVTTTGEVDYVQGVTDTTIKVGNTAVASGLLQFVGVPFNDAMRAVFKQVNDAGGIDGRMIEFITYDDTFFDAAKGLAFTEKLVEEDEVFALVGHFGTPTVTATLEYIQTTGVPMVYAATGINGLFFEETVGNPIMAVQPIYLTDGRIMTARALQENLYGENEDQPLAADAKVGVLFTNDDVGNSIKAGIEIEAVELGKSANFMYLAVTQDTVSSAVNYLKANGIQVAILAMNQAPLAYTLSAMNDASLEIPVFTSYVNADPSAVNHLEYSENRPVYTNAWVDVLSEQGALEAQDFIACINQADLDANLKVSYYGNAYAVAGYIAASIFVEGLQRVADAGLELTWSNYIAQMESEVIDIPMGGIVDFTNGRRWGVSSMSLLEYGFTVIDGDNPATADVVETSYVVETFTKVREIQTIEEIEALNQPVE